MPGPVGRALRSTETFGVALFFFASAFPPFDDLTSVDLTTHMLQHVLVVLAGVLVAWPRFRRSPFGSRQLFGWLSLAAAMALIVFWHLPGPWDTAVLNPGIHALEHLSFFGVGLLIGSWVTLLSDSAKIGALLTAFFGHMAYAVVLISPWNLQVYALYSLPDQVVLGWSLLLTGPLLLVGVAYVVMRNPGWLGGFSGKGTAADRRETAVDRVHFPRWTAVLMTLLLILATISYFGATAFALGGQSTVGPEGSVTVSIVETPVSWQFEPQNIHVVLGVNSTVYWVSHSLSYDTVTSKAGAFDSGPIAPGGAYAFSFSAPGVYEYYCIYHPWMTGVVTVTG